MIRAAITHDGRHPDHLLTGILGVRYTRLEKWVTGDSGVGCSFLKGRTNILDPHKRKGIQKAFLQYKLTAQYIILVVCNSPHSRYVLVCLHKHNPTITFLSINTVFMSTLSCTTNRATQAHKTVVDKRDVIQRQGQRNIILQVRVQQERHVIHAREWPAPLHLAR